MCLYRKGVTEREKKKRSMPQQVKVSWWGVVNELKERIKQKREVFIIRCCEERCDGCVGVWGVVIGVVGLGSLSEVQVNVNVAQTLCIHTSHGTVKHNRVFKTRYRVDKRKEGCLEGGKRKKWRRLQKKEIDFNSSGKIVKKGKKCVADGVG